MSTGPESAVPPAAPPRPEGADPRAAYPEYYAAGGAIDMDRVRAEADAAMQAAHEREAAPIHPLRQITPESPNSRGVPEEAVTLGALLWRGLKRPSSAMPTGDGSDSEPGHAPAPDPDPPVASVFSLRDTMNEIYEEDHRGVYLPGDRHLGSIFINDPAPTSGDHTTKAVKGHRPQVATPVKRKDEYGENIYQYEPRDGGGRNIEEAARVAANTWIGVIKRRAIPLGALALAGLMAVEPGVAEAMFAQAGHHIDATVDYFQGLFSAPIRSGGFVDTVIHGHFPRGKSHPMEWISTRPYSEGVRNIGLGREADFADRNHLGMRLGGVALIGGVYGARKVLKHPKNLLTDPGRLVTSLAGLPIAGAREINHKIIHPVVHAAHRVRHPRGAHGHGTHGGRRGTPAAPARRRRSARRGGHRAP